MDAARSGRHNAAMTQPLARTLLVAAVLGLCNGCPPHEEVVFGDAGTVENDTVGGEIAAPADGLPGPDGHVEEVGPADAGGGAVDGSIAADGALIIDVGADAAPLDSAAEVVSDGGGADGHLADGGPDGGQQLDGLSADGGTALDVVPSLDAVAADAGDCSAGESTCKCTWNEDCAPFQDNNPCNGILVCDAASHKCVPAPATVITCPGGSQGPCETYGCNPNTGKCEQLFVDGKACDDGLPCTVATLCIGGKCVGKTNTCKCSADADCAKQDDPDLCNAKLQCVQGQCVPDPATVVDCGELDGPCLVGTCLAATGKCLAVAKADGVGCDDGEVCTSATTCKGGECTFAKSQCPCAKTADCAAFDDGDLCNGALYCDVAAGTCRTNAAAVVVCDPTADTPCTMAACDPKSGGCKPMAVADGTACDDGKPCIASLCQAGTCVSGKDICTCKTHADCAKLDDNNLCNGTLYCDRNSSPWSCKPNPATVTWCDPVADSACLKSTCEPKSGKCVPKPANEGAPCVDGTSCTKDDKCKAGKCTSAKPCACAVDADCAKLDDGNICNGKLFCDRSGPKWSCKVAPSTVVHCAGQTGPCSSSQCDPKTGACKAMAVVDGTPCEDGKGCTSGDNCKAAVCVGGQNACQCMGDTDCLKFDDADACNGKPVCVGFPGKCLHDPAKAVFCDGAADTACALNTCDPKTGKCYPKPRKDGLTCDDGHPCSPDDACKGGKCVPNKPCVCEQDADCAKFDDGDPCNGSQYCAKAKAPWSCKPNPATGITCSIKADTVCKTNHCEPKTGKCKFLARNEGFGCEDGDICTTSTCKGGSCVLHKKQCQCQTHADCLPFDDGNLCNGAMYCDKSKAPYKCVGDPAGAVSCDPKVAGVCTANSCDPKSGKCGLQPVSASKPCSDGDNCTSGDHCQGGVCKKGTPSCQCQTDSDCAALGDGDACNGTLYCDRSGTKWTCKAVPFSSIACKQTLGKPCLKSACQPKTGKCAAVPKAVGAACDDGNVCTSGDGCSKTGACIGTPQGCKCGKDADCAVLNDGNPCTGTFSCDLGQCQLDPAALLDCQGDDEAQCPQKVCSPQTGKCVASGKEGTYCNDGDVCTNGERCLGGQCAISNISQQLICKCTAKHLDNCFNELGKDPCSGLVYCDMAGPAPMCAITGQVKCDTSADDACAQTTCDSASAKCIKAPVQPKVPGGVVLCDDGDTCTSNDLCVAGACAAGKVNICPCGSDADCFAKIDDGDLCNGVPWCDKSGKSPVCKNSPASVIYCDPSKDHACEVNLCWPKTGQCKVTPTKNIQTVILTVIDPATGQPKKVVKKVPHDKAVNDFVACDDGSNCTVNDECIGKQCTPGKTLICKCQVDADCAASDDGNLCNGTLYCDGGACKADPSTPVVCDQTKDTFCKKNVCAPTKGTCAMQAVNSGKICDDGNPCTANDVCKGGACTPGGTFICQCQEDADCAKWDDGDACNGVAYCDLGDGQCKNNPATVVGCDSGADTACAKSICAKKTGKCALIPVNDGKVCPAGEPCLVASTCKSGKCGGGTNICACQTAADCAQGDVGCGAKLYCDRSKPPYVCKTAPSTAVYCDPEQAAPCHSYWCDNKVGGCVSTPLPGGACSDGDPCTVGDKCVGGVCKPLTDLCDCHTKGDCAGALAGDACQGMGWCDHGALPYVCAADPATVKWCDPALDDDCKQSSCDPKTGACAALKAADGDLCDDGDLCSIGDACIGGVCSKGPLSCACLKDADCAVQDDGNPCTGSLYCDLFGKQPVCKPDPATVIQCKAPEPASCLSSACDAKTGKCVQSGAPDGTPCGDGLACKAGVCAP